MWTIISHRYISVIQEVCFIDAPMAKEALIGFCLLVFSAPLTSNRTWKSKLIGIRETINAIS